MKIIKQIDTQNPDLWACTAYSADSITEQSILESLEDYMNNVNLDNEELLLFLDTKLGKSYTQ